MLGPRLVILSESSQFHLHSPYDVEENNFGRVTGRFLDRDLGLLEVLGLGHESSASLC